VYWTKEETFVPLPSELVTDHFNIDLLTHLEPEITDEILVHPRFKLTHPDRNVSINTNWWLANRGAPDTGRRRDAGES